MVSADCGQRQWHMRIGRREGGEAAHDECRLDGSTQVGGTRTVHGVGHVSSPNETVTRPEKPARGLSGGRPSAER